MSQIFTSPRFAPVPEIDAAVPKISQRIETLRQSLAAGFYLEITSGFGPALLTQQHRLMEAHEGTVWLINDAQTHLIPIWNNGPWAESFVEKHQQPIDKGLVSMVFQTGMSFCEADVHLHSGQDGTVDRLTGRITCSMAIVPLRCGGTVCGVITAVKTKASGEEDPPPFADNATACLGLASAALGAWLDRALMDRALGVDHS